MKIKENLEITTDDFWYDLFMGGYIRPEEICEDKEDIEKIKEAMIILKKFKWSCGDKIKDFYR